jgi:hypothetical protein
MLESNGKNIDLQQIKLPVPTKAEMTHPCHWISLLEILLHDIKLKHGVKVNRGDLLSCQHCFINENGNNLISLIRKTCQIMNCGADADICQIRRTIKSTHEGIHFGLHFFCCCLTAGKPQIQFFALFKRKSGIVYFKRLKSSI